MTESQLAIFKAGGKLYRARPGETLTVDRFKSEKSELLFENVLFLASGDQVEIGRPRLEGVAVKAKIVSEVKSERRKTVKMKRRKGYLRFLGHRNIRLKIKILEIVAKDSKAEVSTSGSPTAKDRKDQSGVTSGGRK